MRTLSKLFPILLSLAFIAETHSQTTGGRWMLGVHGGMNIWNSDLRPGIGLLDRKTSYGADLSLRYGLAPAFSLGVMAGYEKLKTDVAASMGLPYPTLSAHAFPGAVVGWVHLAPGSVVNPYLYFGGGGVLYRRQAAGGRYVPNRDYRTSFLVPVGLGMEIFPSGRLSLVLEAGWRWTDSYVDLLKRDRYGSFATAKAGLNFYFGSDPSDDDDHDGLSNGDERAFGTNVREEDTDGDGLLDGEEVASYKTNPLRTDTDSDGLPDGDEVKRLNTDPTNADSDGDGLLDGDEVLKFKTDPKIPDTDHDGLSDGDEHLRYKSNPVRMDTDNDGLSDADEVIRYKTDPSAADTDGDGLSDREELTEYRTDPLRADTDGGGLPDGVEIQQRKNPLAADDDAPQQKITLEKGKRVVLQGVNFESGKATLTRESEATLKEAYRALMENPEVRVEIAGYTDNVGGVKTNQALSLRRARTVKEWLVRRGISAKRLTAVGKGMKDPLADNRTPEGRAKNRRIEFRVLP